MKAKDQLLVAINKAVPLKDYNRDDYIFSTLYRISAIDMAYILL